MSIPHISNAHDCGVLLTQLRESTGKSRRETAMDIGVNPVSLRQWETGSHMPTLPKLDVVLRFYAQSVTFGYPPQPDPGQVVTS